MVGSPVLVPLKRNARASMAMRQGLRFPCKTSSLRDTMQALVVAIHQPVLKSTTRLGSLLWLIWFVSFVWLNKTNQRNQMNQTDEIDQIGRELPLGVRLEYSDIE